VQGVVHVVGVRCQEDVVRIRDEILKSLVVVLVGRPGLSVNRGVLVAELIVDSSSIESFPSGVWHCCLKLRITFLFSR
jgi:hypothetical protein